MTYQLHGQIEPLHPGQKVVVFEDDCLSGATIGYQAKIVRVHTTSLRRYPTAAEQWIYQVDVPALHSSLNVRAADLFVPAPTNSTHEKMESKQPTCTYCEVRLHGSIDTDNALIEGAYRPPGATWRLFSFRKCLDARARYELTHSMPPHSTRVGRLSYRVPQSQQLDRRYVLDAIAELLGANYNDEPHRQ